MVILMRSFLSAPSPPRKSILFLHQAPAARAASNLAPTEGKVVASGTQPQHGAQKLPFGNRGVTALRLVGQMASGTVLFGLYASVKRRLESKPYVLHFASLLGVHPPPPLLPAPTLSPPVAAAIGGACGGVGFALMAAPIAAFLRTGNLHARVLVKGLPHAVCRDACGFAAFFSAFAWAHPKCQALILDSELEARHPVLASCAASGGAGGAAGLAGYVVGSPFDTIYKVRRGWRPADAPLLSLRRTLTSPRGVRAVAAGAATFAAMELVQDVLIGAQDAAFLTEHPELVDERRRCRTKSGECVPCDAEK